MRTIVVALLFTFLSTWFMSVYEYSDSGESGKQTSSRGAAINFMQYRQAAMNYSYYYPDAPDGEISENELVKLLTPDWQMYHGHTWHARIHEGFVYVWGEASPMTIRYAREMAGNSLSVGTSINGFLMPGNIELPEFITEECLASVTGSATYKPDNENYQEIR